MAGHLSRQSIGLGSAGLAPCSPPCLLTVCPAIESPHARRRPWAGRSPPFRSSTAGKRRRAFRSNGRGQAMGAWRKRAPSPSHRSQLTPSSPRVALGRTVRWPRARTGRKPSQQGRARIIAAALFPASQYRFTKELAPGIAAQGPPFFWRRKTGRRFLSAPTLDRTPRDHPCPFPIISPVPPW